MRLGRFVLTQTFHRAGSTRRFQTDFPALIVIADGIVAAAVDRRRHELHSGCAILRPAAARCSGTFKTDAATFVIELPPDIEPIDAVVVEPTARAWALGLVHAVSTREPGWELVAEGEVLIGLGRLERIRKLAPVRPSWLDEVTDLARQQLSLITIAARVKRHPSHVARQFRRHQGVSIGDYARRCRLELAAHALRAGEPIADVALDAGFCDQSHFTNAFHRVFGMTPAEFRRGR